MIILSLGINILLRMKSWGKRVNQFLPDANNAMQSLIEESIQFHQPHFESKRGKSLRETRLELNSRISEWLLDGPFENEQRSVSKNVLSCARETVNLKRGMFSVPFSSQFKRNPNRTQKAFCCISSLTPEFEKSRMDFRCKTQHQEEHTSSGFERDSMVIKKIKSDLLKGSFLRRVKRNFKDIIHTQENKCQQENSLQGLKAKNIHISQLALALPRDQSKRTKPKIISYMLRTKLRKPENIKTQLSESGNGIGDVVIRKREFTLISSYLAKEKL